MDHPAVSPRGQGGETILVAGATGMLGREVARALRGDGYRIKALSRDPGRAATLDGITDSIVLGDATRPETLDGALDGVDAVISCLGAPMAFTRQERRGFAEIDTVANRNLIEAAVAAGIRRFVYVSLVIRPEWADTAYARAHEDAVDLLKSSGMSYGIVRPTGMFPVFDPFVPMARRGLAWIPGDGRARTNPIHPVEVAAVCVSVLSSSQNIDVPLGGPDTLTREEIVRLAFAATGRHARIVHLPRWALIAAAALLRPVHPHLGEVTDFAARALTADFLAPAAGERRLADHFAGVVAGADQAPADVDASVAGNGGTP